MERRLKGELARSVNTRVESRIQNLVHVDASLRQIMKKTPIKMTAKKVEKKPQFALGALIVVVILILSCCCAADGGGGGGVLVAAEAASSTTDDGNSGSSSAPSEQPRYGVDVTWPTHHLHPKRSAADGGGGATSSPPATPAGGGREYRNFLAGCAERYSAEACARQEEDRLALNLAQPRHMTNYTSAGYAKVRCPSRAFSILSKFWDESNGFRGGGDAAAAASPRGKRRREDWSEGDTYVNHWDSPTDVVLLEGDGGPHQYPGLSPGERRAVAEDVRDVLERWTGTSLIATSMYGIRVYGDGSILAPHVDRTPLVVSAIINVDQDVQEDWILEVIDHGGVARNVTLQPGEMVLYESASIIHGRPFPLRGRYYANVFVHFEPIGYTEALERKLRRLKSIDAEEGKETKRGHPSRSSDAKELFEKTLAKLMQRDGNVNKGKEKAKVKTLPSYIREDSLEAQRWRQEYAFYRREPKPTAELQKQKATQQEPPRGVHIHAATGNLVKIKDMEKDDPGVLFRSDGNGWKPIHEASRAGKTNVVEYLIKKGADVNERTNNGKGANSLWWAKQQLPENHPVIKLLEQHGAAAIGPHE